MAIDEGKAASRQPRRRQRARRRPDRPARLAACPPGATVAAIVIAVALGQLAAPGSAPAAPCPPPTSSVSSGGGSPSSAAVDDPLFGRQWGLQQIGAPAAWARGAKGAGTVVAIIDSGVDLEHPDLQRHLVPGTDLVPAPDDCQPGPDDENGHGTHVAGIAAAVTDNGIGVAGTAPEARLMPVRVLDASGKGELKTVVAGIRYAADHGGDVINLSLSEKPLVGQSAELNRDLEAAIDHAWSKGAVVVAAAGNDTFPACSYPSAARHALCVAATDRRGNPSFYSNFPVSPTGAPGLRAPGGVGSPLCEDDEDIWSTILPGSPLDCRAAAALRGYDTLAGTSMAAPFVSGVAAILVGEGLTNAQVVDCLKATSSNRGRWDAVYGYGIVDAATATARCAATSPSPPPGSGGEGQPPPGGGAGSPPASRPQPGPRGSAPSSPPPQRVAVRVRLRADRIGTIVRRRRIRLRVATSGPVTLRLVARARMPRAARCGSAKRLVVAKRTVFLGRPGRRHLSMKLRRRGARCLGRVRRARKRARLTVSYRAVDRAGRASTARTGRTLRR